MSAAAMLAGAAPGPAPDWHSIDWKKVYRTVRRLQARIVKAVRAGRWNKVKALVYLLTHSFSGRALAILRVVSNSGARTPGVDGVLWNTPEAKSAAFSALRRHGYQPQPLRRVYIPKSNGNDAAAGIPTMADRAMQALYLLGLDPIEETLADGHSYGFRLERCCADALANAQGPARPSARSRPGFSEGDIKSCFDGSAMTGCWPTSQWTRHPPEVVESRFSGEARPCSPPRKEHLKAGSSSPALANRTLDGLERLLAERFATDAEAGGRTRSTWSAMSLRTFWLSIWYPDPYDPLPTTSRPSSGRLKPR